ISPENVVSTADSTTPATPSPAPAAPPSTPLSPDPAPVQTTAPSTPVPSVPPTTTTSQTTTTPTPAPAPAPAPTTAPAPSPAPPATPPADGSQQYQSPNNADTNSTPVSNTQTHTEVPSIPSTASGSYPLNINLNNLVTCSFCNVAITIRILSPGDDGDITQT